MMIKMKKRETIARLDSVQRSDGELYNVSVGQSRGVTFQTLRLHQWKHTVRVKASQSISTQKPITYWKSSVTVDVYSIVSARGSNLLCMHSSNHRMEKWIWSSCGAHSNRYRFILTHWNDMCTYKLKDIESGGSTASYILTFSEHEWINRYWAMLTKAHVFPVSSHAHCQAAQVNVLFTPP